jgi:hypothetical protein
MGPSFSKVVVFYSFLSPSEIISGVCGRLCSENIIGALLQGGPCFWCIVESPPPQAAPPSHAWNPVQDWKEAIHQLFDLPNMKIRITENT